jgi:hypothetical protein
MVKLRQNDTPRGRTLIEVGDEVVDRAGTVTTTALTECNSAINLVAKGLVGPKNSLSEILWG